MGRCILCHGLKFNEVNNYRQSPNIYGQSHKVSLPQDVINSCSKYLQNFIQSVDWDVSATDGEAFCSECNENTKKLSKLNVQIEIIENEISQLVNNITERISKERRNYELLENAGSIATQIQKSSLLPYPSHNHQNTETPTPICEIVIDTEYLQQSSEYYCGSESNNNNDPTTVIGIVETTIEHPTSSSRQAIKVGREKKPIRDSVAKGFARNDSVVTSTDLHQRVNDGYECQKCHKKFTHLTILQRHDCDNPTHDCDICGKSFSSHASLKLHSKTHTGEKPHKCDYCGKGFGLPHHLRMHIRTHTGEKPYQCKFCEKRFSDFKCYKTHLLKHSTDESLKRKFKCDLCLKTFTLFGTLKRHYGVHKGDTPFRCEICGKSFVHAKSLQNHNLVHTKVRAYECKSCGRTYKRLDTLKVHELTHTQEKSFQCEQCGKRYHTQQKLREHISACHKEEGEFICETCGKTCINSTLLKSHKKIHDKNPNKEKIKCTICEKEYAKKTALLKHLKTVHIVTTGHTAPCAKCGVSYNNIVDLENHKLTKHSHGFQYKCKLCRVEISSRCELTCHYAEIHKGEEMPYKCKICKITFKSKVELTRHNTELPCVVPIQSVKTTRRSRKQVLMDRVDSDDNEYYINESDSLANSNNSNENSKNKDRQKWGGRRRGRKTVKKVVTYKEETSGSEECSDVVVKTESNDWIKQEQEDYTD